MSVTYNTGINRISSALTTLTVANVAPQGQLTNSGTIDQGGSATVSFSNIIEPVDTSLTYSYDFGDGNGFVSGTATQALPGSITGLAGTHLITGRIFDGTDYSVYQTTLLVRDVPVVISIDNNQRQVFVNEGSVASLGGTFTNPGGAAVVLSASMGSITKDNAGSGKWLWTYAATDGTANSQQQVLITALDGDGSLTQLSFELQVANVRPTATFTGMQINEGGTASVSFTQVHDASLVDQSASFSYAYNFGDGKGFVAGTQTQQLPVGLLANNGVVNVQGRLTDKDGGVSYYNTQVIVANVAPTVTDLSVTAAIQENGTVTLQGSFTDAGLLDRHQVRVNWGDGSISQATVDAVTRTFTAVHTYLDDGLTPVATGSDDFLINVQLRDADGAIAERTVLTRVTNAVPLLAPLNVAAQVDEGGTVTLTGSFTDQGTLDSHTVVIAWGDGQTETVRSPGGRHVVDLTTGPVSADSGLTVTNTTTANGNEVRVDFALGVRVESIDIANIDQLGGTIRFFDLNGDLVSTTDIPQSYDQGAPQHVFVNNGTGTRMVISFAGKGTLQRMDYTDLVTDRSFSIQHRYLDDKPGTEQDSFTITATVTDDDGSSASVSTSLTVNNVTPVFVALTNNAAVPGALLPPNQTVTVSGSFTDPGILDQHRVTVNWGDGTVLTTVTLAIGERSFALDHYYVTPGVFTITSTVNDDDSNVVSTESTTAFLSGVSLHDGVLYIIGTPDDNFVRITESASDTSVASGKSITVEADFPQNFGAGLEFANGLVHQPYVFDAALVNSFYIRLLGEHDHDVLQWVGSESNDRFVVTNDSIFTRDRAAQIFSDELEVVELDGGAGNDEFTVLSTNAHTTTRLSGGLGSDSFSLGGDAGSVTVNKVLQPAQAGPHTLDNIKGVLDINGAALTLTRPSASSVAKQSADLAASYDALTVYSEKTSAQVDGVLTATKLTGLDLVNGVTYGGIEALTIELGSGADSFTVASTHSGSTKLNTYGGSDNVTVLSTSGVTTVNTGDGDDTVDASASSLGIIVFGGTGADMIIGGSGDDVLFGEAGNDLLQGNDGNDSLIGDLGNYTASTDTVVLTEPSIGGNDFMLGGLGNDRLWGGSGNDVMLGGLGQMTSSLNPDGTRRTDVLLLDKAYLTGSVALAGATVPVPSTSIVDKLINTDVTLLTGVYNVDGTKHLNADGTWDTRALLLSLVDDGDDELVGGNGSDALYGQRGNDKLSGEAGDDFLAGGTGNDVVDGGIGNDTLVGDEALIDSSNPMAPNVAQGFLVMPVAGDLVIPVHGKIIVPMLAVTPGREVNAAASVLPHLFAYNPAIPVDNSLHTVTGERVVVYASVITDIAHHLNLLNGNDRLTGGDGNDTLVGDDMVVIASTVTFDARAMAKAEVLTRSLLTVSADFSDLIHNQYKLLGTHRDVESEKADDLLVIDNVYHLGEDYLDGGAGNNVLVGFNSISVVTSFTLSVTLAEKSEWFQKDLADTAEEIINATVDLDYLEHRLRDKKVQVQVGKKIESRIQHHVDRIFMGNDTLLGGEGSDLIIGDALIVHAALVSLTAGVPLTSTVIVSGEEGHDNWRDEQHWNERGERSAWWKNMDYAEHHAYQLDLMQVNADIINGGAGDDLIWGDSLALVNTRIVRAAGISNKVFEDASHEAQEGLDQSVMLTTGLTNPENGSSLNASDIISGGAGNDIIFGQNGQDQLWGDAGNDWLLGGAGKDTLNGGTGANQLYSEETNTNKLRSLITSTMSNWSTAFTSVGLPVVPFSNNTQTASGSETSDNYDTLEFVTSPWNSPKPVVAEVSYFDTQSGAFSQASNQQQPTDSQGQDDFLVFMDLKP